MEETFLNTQLKRTANGMLVTSEYRELMFTDLMLGFQINRPKVHKYSLVLTVVNRTKTFWHNKIK